MAALQQHLTNSRGQIKDVPQPYSNTQIFGPKNPQSFPSELDSLTWLHEFAPHFAIAGDAIEVIEEPSAFYETILKQCSTAKRWVTSRQVLRR